MTEPAIAAPRPGKAARNEMRKALATTGNALSIAMLVTVFLQPVSSGRAVGLAGVSAVAAFIALQVAAHYVLRKMED